MELKKKKKIVMNIFVSPDTIEIKSAQSQRSGSVLGEIEYF